MGPAAVVGQRGRDDQDTQIAEFQACGVAKTKGERMSIRILLADDHKLLREGFRALISEQSNMEVVAEAEDGRAAVQMARDMSPDVVIMDISMPGLNGIEATRRILEENPNVRIVGLSMHLDKRMVLEMLKAGAAGYLLKDCAFGEVIEAIQAITAPGVYLGAPVTEILVKAFVQRFPAEDLLSSPGLAERDRTFLRQMLEGKDMKETSSLMHMSGKKAEAIRQQLVLQHMVPRLLQTKDDARTPVTVSLTPREQEILIWVRDGKSTGDIASILKISQDTVKFHMKNIFQKLNATSRSQAIAIAIENKLIEMSA
jgi:DNA-binding NarL/FixJ family response regulator